MQFQLLSIFLPSYQTLNFLCFFARQNLFLCKLLHQKWSQQGKHIKLIKKENYGWLIDFLDF